MAALLPVLAILALSLTGSCSSTPQRDPASRGTFSTVAHSPTADPQENVLSAGQHEDMGPVMSLKRVPWFVQGDWHVEHDHGEHPDKLEGDSVLSSWDDSALLTVAGGKPLADGGLSKGQVVVHGAGTYVVTGVRLFPERSWWLSVFADRIEAVGVLPSTLTVHFKVINWLPGEVNSRVLCILDTTNTGSGLSGIKVINGLPGPFVPPLAPAASQRSIEPPSQGTRRQH